MTRLRLRALIPGWLALAVTGCDSDSAESAATPAPPSLQLSPVRRDTLTDTQMARIRVLQETFAEVDTSSLETWVDNFKRDMNPDNELAHWESIAKAYHEYTAVRNLVPGAKSDVFQILLLRSSAPDSWVLANMRLRALSVDEAKQVLKHYTAAPAPIKVSPGTVR